MKICILTIFAITILTSCTEKSEETTKAQLAENAVSIEYIAHACFILKAGDSEIMIDPYADQVWLGYGFQGNISVDAVFITHPHYDHDGGIFRGMRPYWMLETPFYQNPEEYKIGDFEISGVIGKHADPYGKEFGQMNTIWKIAINGIVFAHWGDNGPLTQENFDELNDVDVLMIPMDGDYHIISSEAYAETFKFLEPKVIIPMHYRIPELEIDPKSPSNLGEIGPFLEKRPHISTDSLNTYLPDVRYIESNSLIISNDELPARSTYFVFNHSTTVHPSKTH